MEQLRHFKADLKLNNVHINSLRNKSKLQNEFNPNSIQHCSIHWDNGCEEDKRYFFKGQVSHRLLLVLIFMLITAINPGEIMCRMMFFATSSGRLKCFFM